MSGVQKGGRNAETALMEAVQLYNDRGICAAVHLPVMMRKVGKGYVHARPSPFDLMGTCVVECRPDGRLQVPPLGGRRPKVSWHAVGLAAECKSTTKPETGIRIVPAGKKGAGVQYHQLAALAEWHDLGGLALIVWRRAGLWYRLRGKTISDLIAGHEDAGVKRIPFDIFEPVSFMGDVPLFLDDLTLEAR